MSLKSLLLNMFSTKQEGEHTVVRILGFKIKLKDRYRELLEDLALQKKGLQSQKNAIIDILQNIQYEKYKNNPITIDSLCFSGECKSVSGNLDGWILKNRNSHLPILFNNPENFYTLEKTDASIKNADVVYLWGFWDEDKILKVLPNLVDKPLLFVEDGFLKSILTGQIRGESKYHSGVCFTVDDLTFYFDATRPSRLELMLNSEDIIISEEQKARAKNLIEKIVINKLTKYNHQPIMDIKIGREGKKKVLVVDQSYGDYSIFKGLATDKTFEEMLNCAIAENPDADIIIKTHPDTIAKQGVKSGFYCHIKQHENIYPINYNINPISLIQQVDKVYVCTSQLGFEALMCGKEVHVFGMPFYAGWGITNDRLHCNRRTKQRNLEELFYITYVLYSHYVDPVSKSTCEIEQAIEYLLELREDYFINN